MLDEIMPKIPHFNVLMFWHLGLPNDFMYVQYARNSKVDLRNNSKWTGHYVGLPKIFKNGYLRFMSKICEKYFQMVNSMNGSIFLHHRTFQKSGL